MKVLIGVAVILLVCFIVFALGVITGAAISNVREEQKHERY